MTSVGIITSLAGTICWAICVFPFTKAGRLMTVESMNLFRLVVGTILVMIVASIFETNNFGSVFSYEYMEAWLWLGLSGILALGIGDYFNYRMYVLIAHVVYKEKITKYSLAAVLVAISGVVILIWRMKIETMLV